MGYCLKLYTKGTDISISEYVDQLESYEPAFKMKPSMQAST